MRKFLCLVVLAICALIVSSSSSYAQNEKGHYVAGVEGIKAASLPPPGVYFRWYNAFYNAGTLMDGNGDEAPVGFDVSVYAMVNRLIWITDKKVLGGYFGMDMVIPLIRTDLEITAAGLKDKQFGLGDLYLEPVTLSWHGPRYDAAVGLSFYLPTGQYDKTEPASAGQDFTTTMLTFGATLYLDPARTWTASVLGRYEINSEKSETDVKPGQDLVLEYGLARNVAKFWDIGIAGYYIGQLTDDSGAGAVWDTSVHDRVFAIGPEVSHFCMARKMFLSVRSLWETGARDRSQGNMTTVTLTKIF
jgi:hypothetical protein